jgi:xanthine dehydrogenase accessory factor
VAADATAPVVLVRGSGDVGSAVAHLLVRSGYAVVLHDVDKPTAPRRGMAFTDAIFDGSAELEGVTARRVDDIVALAEAACGATPCVTTSGLGFVLAAVQPAALVDARMRKREEPEVQIDLAPLTIGLGPGFVAGQTTHLAVETQWGASLGEVLTAGATLALGGEPRSFDGHARDRFVYAPAAGILRTDAAIGDRVAAGDVVATIGDEQLAAPLDGILRGLTHDGVPVTRGLKVLEVDPRGDPAKIAGIGERPRRIAEGVLAALRSSAGPGARA